MIIPSANRLNRHISNKYALVIAAAKRAKQLKEGHPRLARVPSPNPLTAALEEVAEGLVIPLSPETEETLGIEESGPKVVEREAFDLAAALSAVTREEIEAGADDEEEEVDEEEEEEEVPLKMGDEDEEEEEEEEEKASDEDETGDEDEETEDESEDEESDAADESDDEETG